MRVLWLSHMLPYPPISGALQRAYRLLAGAATRHEVTLVSFTQRRLLRAPEAVADSRRHLERICRTVFVHDVPAEASRAAFLATVARAGLSGSPFAAHRFASAAFARELRRLAAQTGFDLVHVDWPGLAPYVADLPGLPVVLDHHNIESHLTARRAERERHPLTRLYFAKEAEKIARLERRHATAAVNLVCSELDGERLAAVAPGARVVVCPNATDPAFFRPDGAPPEPEQLLFVGSLSWHPNVSGLRWFLGEVWPALTAARPRIVLTVVGADPPGDLVRLASGDARIRLAGRVADVRPYFDRASVFVCPILEGGGTRLKVLDALAMAKPIVSTTLGCEGLDLEPGRDFLAADTPEAFTRETLRLLADPALGTSMGERGRHVVLARYTWERAVERMLGAYETAVAGRQADLPVLQTG